MVMVDPSEKTFTRPGSTLRSAKSAVVRINNALLITVREVAKQRSLQD